MAFQSSNSRAAPAKREIPLHTRIFCGLLLGALCGGLANVLSGENRTGLDWLVDHVAEPAGRVFLRLLLMIVIPLVFSSLALAAAGMGDLRRLGRVGIRMLVYTLLVSGLSVVLGLALANIVQPGQRIPAETRSQLMERYQAPAEQIPRSPGGGLLETIAPENPLAAMTKNPPDMIGIMFFALVFGVALLLIPEERSAPVLAVLEGVYQAVA